MEVKIINGKVKTVAMFVGAIVLLGGIGAGVYYVATNFTQGSITPGDIGGNGGTMPTGEMNFSDGPWSSNMVKKNIRFKDLNGDTVTSGTIYKFSSKPTNSEGDTVWCGMKEDDVSSYRDDAEQISISGNTTTIEDYPGKYYLYVESSGKYDKCVTMTIPDGDNKDLPLYQYQKDPDFVRPTPVLTDHYAPSGLSPISLGIDKNTTSQSETWEEHAEVDPDQGTETRFKKIVASIGTVDYTTDADNSKPSDEGIQSVTLELQGGAQMSKRIYYYNDGIDKLDNENEFVWNVDDAVAKQDDPVDVGVKVTTWNTKTGTGSDGDEALSPGENFLDLVLHYDNGGQSSKIDVTG